MFDFRGLEGFLIWNLLISKRPHLHRAYLLGVWHSFSVSVDTIKFDYIMPKMNPPSMASDFLSYLMKSSLQLKMLIHSNVFSFLLVYIPFYVFFSEFQEFIWLRSYLLLRGIKTVLPIQLFLRIQFLVVQFLAAGL